MNDSPYRFEIIASSLGALVVLGMSIYRIWKKAENGQQIAGVIGARLLFLTTWAALGILSWWTVKFVWSFSNITSGALLVLWIIFGITTALWDGAVTGMLIGAAYGVIKGIFMGVLVAVIMILVMLGLTVVGLILVRLGGLESDAGGMVLVMFTAWAVMIILSAIIGMITISSIAGAVLGGLGHSMSFISQKLSGKGKRQAQAPSK